MSALPPQRQVEEDDSEDDPDFIPHAGDSGSSESEPEAPDAKRQKCTLEENKDDRARKDAARSKLWEDFQASVSTPPRQPKQPELSKKTIKIIKKYRFAGEDVIKVEEVPEDSEDAKKWPPWNEHTEDDISNDPADSTHSPSPLPSSSSTPQPETQTPQKRHGPRRPRRSLDAMLATAKAKKLTTLDKSAMDWKEHVQSSAEIKEDLEANRRTGGYLEKVEFLQRVEQRKEAEREQLGSKRRRR